MLKQSIPIESSDTGETLHRSLSEIGATLIVETLENLEIGNLTASPQTQEGATYAKKLNPEAAQLDWTQSAFDLERQIRAFKPWPGSWFEYEGIRIKVITAETKEESGQPGIVLDDQLTVACGQGSLRLLDLQRPGKRVVETAAFLRGMPIPPKTKLK